MLIWLTNIPEIVLTPFKNSREGVFVVSGLMANQRDGRGNRTSISSQVTNIYDDEFYSIDRSDFPRNSGRSATAPPPSYESIYGQNS